MASGPRRLLVELYHPLHPLRNRSARFVLEYKPDPCYNPPMIHVPSVLGHIIAGSGAKTYRNRERDGRPRRNLQGRKTYGKVPLPIYADLATRPAGAYRKLDVYTLRRSFQYADELYHNMTPGQRAVWKAAITKPKMSAYDLWMKEALTLLLQGKPPPDQPSRSGGWSTGKVIEGTQHWTAPCWGGPGLSHYRQWLSDPDYGPGWVIWSAVWHSTQPPLGGQPSKPITSLFGWDPDTESWKHGPYTFNLNAPTYYIVADHVIPYCYWCYRYLDPTQDPPLMRYYKGQAWDEVTWYAQCPEEFKWHPPPPRDYPLTG